MKYSSIFLLLVLVFTACKKKHQIDVESPDLIPLKEIPTPSTSFIGLPIEISVDEIQDQVNNEFKGVIYKDSLYTDNNNDDLKLTIEKLSDITFNVDSNKIYYKVPLKLWAAIKKNVLGIKVEKSTDFEAVIDFTTTVNLKEDWNTNTNTEVVAYKLLSNPIIDFGFIKIPISNIITGILEDNIPFIEELIDQSLKDQIDTRKIMEELWQDIQEPVLVDEDYSAWLIVKPKNFYISPLKSIDKKLAFDAGVETKLDLFLGDKPKIEKNKYLPNLKFTEQVNNDFKIALASEFTFDQANRILKKELKNYVYEMKKKTVTVLEADMYPNGDKVIVKLLLGGDIEGNLFLTGRPAYDSATTSMLIRDFEFDVKTKKALINVGDWLLHGTFVRKIQKQLSFSMIEQLEETEKVIEQSLHESDFDENIRFFCDIKTIRPGEIIVAERSLKTMVVVEGKAKLKYQ